MDNLDSLYMRRVTRPGLAASLALLMALLGLGCGKPQTESSPASPAPVTVSPMPEAAAAAPAGQPAEPAAPDAAAETQPPIVETSDWPGWRGPAMDNRASANQDPPLSWSATENVVWRVTLPGRGHASPCIVGDRIYLPAADAEQQTIWMLCLDRESGRTLWQKEVYHGPMPKIHPDNSHATATPRCDGQRIYFPYQTPESAWVAAFDLEGAVVWNKEVALYKTLQGYSASPVVHEGRVIVPIEGWQGHTIHALDAATGAEVWKSPLPEGHESYASPVLAHVAGRDQVVISGAKKTTSFDPASGKQLWICDGPAQYCTATPAYGDTMIFTTGGNPEKTLLAIRADGAGDVTATHLAWKGDMRSGYVPSLLLHDGLLYGLNETGLLRCYRAIDGRIEWEQPLKAPTYSSPTLAGGRIYLFDRKGKGYVFKPGTQFELLGGGELPDGMFANPVIVGGRIYLRTMKEFYCLGKQG